MINQIAKYGIFTLIYLILNWFISDEIACALQGNASCLFAFFSKYIVFMILMIIYDKWIKKKIISNSKK
ncbi:hypothetical protein [Myroides sp. LJL119]